MTNAGVPCIPGYHGNDQDPYFLAKKADEIGFPIMIKATLGGGGNVNSNVSIIIFKVLF